jgi:hypothetical protein
MDFRVLKYFPFGGAKRFDVVAEFFNLFNSANVSQINPVFGSGLTPIPGFRQPIAGTVACQVQSPWILSSEVRLRMHLRSIGVLKMVAIYHITGAFRFLVCSLLILRLCQSWSAEERPFGVFRSY